MFYIQFFCWLLLLYFFFFSCLALTIFFSVYETPRTPKKRKKNENFSVWKLAQIYSATLPYFSLELFDFSISIFMNKSWLVKLVIQIFILFSRHCCWCCCYYIKNNHSTAKKMRHR